MTTMRDGLRLWNCLLGLSILAAATACTPPPVYQVRRAALVQAPAPPAWSGKIHGHGLSVGDSSVLWKNPPHGAPETESGLYVALTQIEGAMHFKLHDNIALWIPGSYGFREGAFDAVPCLAEAPSSGVPSFGLGLGVSGELTEQWYLGVALELMGASIPSRVQWECVARCDTVSALDASGERQETDVVAVFRGSLLAGYQFAWGRVFGGVSVRNHPTNVRITTESHYSTEFIDDEVSGGPMYALPGVGVELDVTDFLSAAVQLYQPLPLAEHDLIYGPIGGLVLDLHLPDYKRPAMPVHKLPER